MKIYFDFDNTIVNSIESFCNVYNFLYDDKADWGKVRQWNMGDQCKQLDKDMIVRIFEDGLFFQNLKFFDNRMYFLLEDLSKTDDLHIISVGSRKNLLYKRKWILENLPFINDKNIALLSHFDEGSHTIDTIDKSEINLENSILIDDNQDALESSNATYKVLYSHRGIKAEWNEKIFGKYPMAYDLDSLYKIISDIKKSPTN